MKIACRHELPSIDSTFWIIPRSIYFWCHSFSHSFFITPFSSSLQILLCLELSLIETVIRLEHQVQRRSSIMLFQMPWNRSNWSRFANDGAIFGSQCVWNEICASLGLCCKPVPRQKGVSYACKCWRMCTGSFWVFLHTLQVAFEYVTRNTALDANHILICNTFLGLFLKAMMVWRLMFQQVITRLLISIVPFTW